jgi:type IV fimbrial biogenesis protein FimT
VFFRPGGPVSLKSNSRSVVFDATKGTRTPTATMQLMSRNGMTLRQVTNIMGQVRSCSPAPAPGLSGYRAC